MEVRLKAYENQSAPKPALTVDQKPTPAQFVDAFEYAEALAEWSAENALKNRDIQEVERKATESRQKVLTDWQKRLPNLALRKPKPRAKIRVDGLEDNG